MRGFEFWMVICFGFENLRLFALKISGVVSTGLVEGIFIIGDISLNRHF
jgi:hypothetical protein